MSSRQPNNPPLPVGEGEGEVVSSTLPAGPIQPVEKPIICPPYDEPPSHWVYRETGEAARMEGRRRAGYWFKGQRVSGAQIALPSFAEEQFDELPLVNSLREDVKRWRNANYEGVTPLTRELLRHWTREDRPRRLFFCQREAVETIIYLAEIRLGGKRTRFTPSFSESSLRELVDLPAEAELEPLTRFGCKMATGSGKTVVMAMLIAWAFCNRARNPSDERFPAAVLVCCPNLTVKERLQVLRPESPDNYYAAFDLVPTVFRPLLQQGKVLVTNWHLFAPESEHVEGGKSYPVVNKGEESPDAFARRVLGDLYERAPLLVLNDEGHHAYRPAPIAEEKLDAEEAKAVQADREEATVWVSGLDRLNLACGVRFCVDLSATPFYIAGSGFPEGAPFPWLVSDFGLVDAIESGIVKIPRLPVSDTTGRPEPQYFRLWQHLNERIPPADRLPGRARKPKPEAVYREVEFALKTLASQWVERFKQIQQAGAGQDKAPPVLIIVCDNTDIAEVLFQNISGERTEKVEAIEDVDDGDDDASAGLPIPAAGPARKAKTRVVYGGGHVFPEYFSNTASRRSTIRIDTKLLAEAETKEPGGSRADAAQELRRIVATVGKPGQPGEQVRCVVSVGMLTEGWDANNVTQILGIRAFGSQLLCEQVVGRGLRRMDYVPDPETGLLTEEYVDVYGIPFSVVPFKGRPIAKPAPEDRPSNHVQALPERAKYELRFPVVESYAFALRRNVIKADIAKLERLALEPNVEPTAVFVRPTVGYRTGPPGGLGPGDFAEQNRQQYYDTTHLQEIEFAVARSIVTALAEATAAGGPSPNGHSRPKLGLQSRHQLFPQVLRLVLEYVERKVDFRGCDPCELGHQRYIEILVERLLAAIEPDDAQGEPPLLPILNRYKPIGTTAEVDFKTIRPCVATQASHINQVAADTNSWEQAATFRLEQLARRGVVWCYARNVNLGLSIPYQYVGVSSGYQPDFLVRLADGRTLILEIKGYEDDEDKAKHAATQRWVSAVNNWGQLGQWLFHVCRDSQLLTVELERI
jgi:type III restriction enzyme